MIPALFFRTAGMIGGEEQCSCGKFYVPTMLTDSGEESVQQADVSAAALWMASTCARVKHLIALSMCEIESESAGGDDFDFGLEGIAEAHDGAVAVGFGDGGESGFEFAGETFFVRGIPRTHGYLTAGVARKVGSETG